MTRLQDVAGILYQLIAGQPLSRQKLLAAGNYFTRVEQQLDPTFILRTLELIRDKVQEQPQLQAVALRWQPIWEQAAGFTLEQAIRFIEEYNSALRLDRLFTQPITAGYTKRVRDQFYDSVSYEAHTSRWSLIYCQEGNAGFRTGSRDLELRQGDVILLEPYAVYTLQRNAGAPYFGYYWVFFQAHNDWRSWLDWPQIAPHICQLSIESSQQDKVESAFADLVECYLSSSAMRTELNHNLLEQLILRCRNSLPSDYRRAQDPRVLKAQQFIEQHYNEPFTLEDVAAAANISSSRLAGLFKTKTGMTVLNWRDEKRIVQAAKLLRDSSLSIAKIAEEVGYREATYFTRAFSRYVGCSPSGYRRKK